ncbi:MAG: dynamin family protein [Rubrivivax sp.]|nr:dynamin family protein [Rubrivivax sp.]
MQSTVVTELEDLARWRSELDRRLAAMSRFLREHDLDADAEMTRLSALRDRIAAERVIVAFVAEFSRGKSELINAIFFADTGRRVLPATPGRTTMCPVELHHDPSQPPSLALLPIETRLQGLSLAELRRREALWQRQPLDPGNPEALARALTEVTRTQPVDEERARALGLWGDDEDDRPPQAADGSVEVPAWRHAVINYPHELLQRGLVVIDTPGLNAIGAEPELTLGLLPTAHATVFLLAADTGVTRSDLAIWRDHLSGSSLQRFVVLNKIDTLVDPLASPAEVEQQISRQREITAQTLQMPAARVFPLSARDALAARVAGDDAELRRSRLPELERALADELMPQQRAMLAAAASELLEMVQGAALRRLAERHRHNAEQLLELRGLRGKSGGKVRLLQQRLTAESVEFETCTARLGALRSVQARMLAGVLQMLSSDRLRTEVTAMNAASGTGPLNLGAAKAFRTLCERLRSTFDRVNTQCDEMQQMLQASVQRLNTEFAFSVVVPMPPSLQRYRVELQRIEEGFSRHLGLTRGWRMSSATYREQFRRMLLSRLRMVFENAAGEVELWCKAVLAPLDQQLRERRQAFTRRREALDRVSGAAGELEARIAEVEAGEQRLAQQQAQLDQIAGEVRACVAELPAAAAESAEPSETAGTQRNAA